MRPTTVDVTLGLVLVCLTMQTTIGADQLTVYPAKTIITMDPSAPKATAVAVRDDRVVAVGTMETLQPGLRLTSIRSTTRSATRCCSPVSSIRTCIPGWAPGCCHRTRSLHRKIGIEGVTDRTGYLARLQELVDREKDYSSRPAV